jgi:hypothetical protein
MEQERFHRHHSGNQMIHFCEGFGCFRGEDDALRRGARLSRVVIGSKRHGDVGEPAPDHRALGRRL